MGTKFMEDTEAAHADKLEQWKKRKELRAGEIAAINKAIAVLNSDEARDTMKSSFKSQGYLQTMLLQKSAKSAVRQRAIETIRKVEISTKDRRLATLRALLHAGEGPI